MSLSVTTTSDVLQSVPRELSYNQIAEYQYCLNGAMEQQEERLKQIQTMQTRLMEYQSLLMLLNDENIQVLFPKDYIQYSITGQSHMTGIQRSINIELHINDHQISIQMNSGKDEDEIKVYYKIQQSIQTNQILNIFEQWCNTIVLKSDSMDNIRTTYDLKLTTWLDIIQNDTRMKREWMLIDNVLRVIIRMLSKAQRISRFIETFRSVVSADVHISHLLQDETDQRNTVIHAPSHT
jgi:hypothetical protein